LIIIVENTLTFSGATLSSAGAAGGNGGTNLNGTNGGGGGGSGGGVIRYFYGRLSGSPTTNVAGGAGGSGSSTGGTGGSGDVTAYQIANMSNDKSSYNFGSVNLSGSSSSGLNYFTLTNNSGVSINVNIYGTDMTAGGCTTMTLSDNATAGANTYGLNAGLNGGSYSVVVKKTAPYNELKHELASSATQAWGLQFLSPTSYTGTCAGGLTGTVTIVATVH
jgi:hypothetical protein